MKFTEAQKEEIYLAYQGKVYAYLQSKLNNRHTAEDLASEVFIKVYEKLEFFDETKASLSTWIYTIARNTLTDYFRTRRVFSEVPEDIQSDSSVEADILNEEMLETLACALEQLDERTRDVIILHFYSGKTLKEIAMQMGVSYAYIKVLQNQAMEKLKIILESSEIQ